jgi:hypothetical protein
MDHCSQNWHPRLILKRPPTHRDARYVELNVSALPRLEDSSGSARLCFDRVCEDRPPSGTYALDAVCKMK